MPKTASNCQGVRIKGQYRPVGAFRKGQPVVTWYIPGTAVVQVTYCTITYIIRKRAIRKERLFTGKVRNSGHIILKLV